ncbi:MAG TPA: hypothetical protein VJ732_19715 [Bryobacteraceae bacterium]|nr:hypothetical protein [Bryobacteraceae bacterium]
MDTAYSHWHQTGATRPAPEKSNPLDAAIAFEKYRLTVVSQWPEGDAKQEKLRKIQRAIQHLESQRAVFTASH